MLLCPSTLCNRHSSWHLRSLHKNDWGEAENQRLEGSSRGQDPTLCSQQAQLWGQPMLLRALSGMKTTKDRDCTTFLGSLCLFLIVLVCVLPFYPGWTSSFSLCTLSLALLPCAAAKSQSVSPLTSQQSLGAAFMSPKAISTTDQTSPAPPASLHFYYGLNKPISSGLSPAQPTAPWAAAYFAYCWLLTSLLSLFLGPPGMLCNIDTCPLSNSTYYMSVFRIEKH